MVMLRMGQEEGHGVIWVEYDQGIIILCQIISRANKQSSIQS